MKKVNSIGKKVMSVALSACLLMVPMSANTCSAAGFNETAKTCAKYTIGIGATLGAVALVYFYGSDTMDLYQDAVKTVKEFSQNSVEAFEEIADLIKGLGKDLYGMGDRICQTLDTLGFKNVFAKISAVYTTKRLFDLGKDTCKKVSSWFSYKKEEKLKNGSKKLKVTARDGRCARHRHQRVKSYRNA